MALWYLSSVLAPHTSALFFLSPHKPASNTFLVNIKENMATDSFWGFGFRAQTSGRLSGLSQYKIQNPEKGTLSQFGQVFSPGSINSAQRHDPSKRLWSSHIDSYTPLNGGQTGMPLWLSMGTVLGLGLQVLKKLRWGKSHKFAITFQLRS